MNKTNLQMDDSSLSVDGYLQTKRIDKEIFENNMNILLHQLQKHIPTMSLRIRYVPPIRMGRRSINTTGRYSADFETPEVESSLTVETWGSFEVDFKKHAKSYKIVSYTDYGSKNRISGKDIQSITELIPKILKCEFNQFTKQEDEK